MAEKLSAPCNVVAAPNDCSVEITWDSVEGAVGYKLFLYLSGDEGNCIKRTAARAAHKTILGLRNGTEYLVQVCAFFVEDGSEILGDLCESVAFVPVSKRLKAQNVICLKIGESATITPERDNKTPRSVFFSEDQDIATVTREGVVTAKSAGVTSIKITSDDGEVFRTRISVQRSFDFRREKAVLMFAGDIMCAAAQQQGTAGYSYDFFDTFSAVKDVLAQADFSACVLNTTCDDSAPFEHEITRLDSGEPNSNSPSSLISAIADAGFSSVVTAENHNTSVKGLTETVGLIKKHGMLNLGTVGDNPVVTEVNGIKVGIIACTMLGGEDPAGGASIVNTFGKYDRDYFLELLNKAFSMGAEYIVAYQHWGALNALRVRKSQSDEAKFMAEAGVNLIVGSHPHTIQRFDYITTSNGRRVPCAYSLGNLLTTMSEIKENRDGVILRVELKRENDAVTTSCSCIPFYSEMRDKGAAITAALPVRDSETAYAADRIKRQLGPRIGIRPRRHKILLSGSIILNRIFGSGKGFLRDNAAVLLSQISLGSAKCAAAAPIEDNKRLTLDFTKDIAGYIRDNGIEYVAVDFYSAASTTCYKLNDSADDCFFTGLKAFRQTEFYAENKHNFTRLRPPFGEGIWKPLIKRYAQMLLEALPRENIILFRCTLSSTRVKRDQLRAFVSHDRQNRFMRAMEDYFISLVNPAVVDLSDKYLGEGDALSAFENEYYIDAYRAAEDIAFGRGRSCVSSRGADLWFSRAIKYYDNMTARSYQSRLLDMSCAADKLIAQTSASFAAKHSERIIRLKRAGKSEISHVKDFFADDTGAAELVQAAEIINALEKGSLNKPYDFFALAFKERFNALRIMIRLLSSEMNVPINEDTVELVFMLRGKSQLKRYLSEANANIVDIWGSGISRESLNRCKGAFIGKYIMKQAPITAFEPPAEINLPEGAGAFCGNEWRRRTFAASIARDGIDVVAASKSKWIVLDFFDLICRMAEYNEELFEIDEFICRTDFYKSIEKNCTECYLFEMRDMKYCFEIIGKFAKMISDKYGSNVILIKTEPKNVYISLDYRLKYLEQDEMLAIKKKFISLCEERFINLTDCYVIDISKRFYASDEFPIGGAGNVYYEEEFYRQAGEYISVILRGSDKKHFSDVDNNYITLRNLKLNRPYDEEK